MTALGLRVGGGARAARKPVAAATASADGSGLRRLAFLLRGVAFVGRRFQCPCCNWRLRAFTAKRAALRATTDGYCPRCNAKARHRRDWLYLRQHTDLFSARLKLLEVGPRWAFARRFQRMPNLHYVGVDVVRRGPEVTTIGDARSLPLRSASFDAVICIHVLEHVENDRQALSEMHRVLKPGGWAIITVPIELDQATFEDPAVTDPDERARLFGERGHVRRYGADFADRLRAAGFEVTLDPASTLLPATRRRFGLRTDENIFHCRRPAPAGHGTV